MNQFLGVDGTTNGWLAVEYRKKRFYGVGFYDSIDRLWKNHSDAEHILIDIPIGLRENSAVPRECDSLARKKLSPDRHQSVFPVPVRPAVRHFNNYQKAKQVQESRTDRSLARQSWAISDKIYEVDKLLRKNEKARKPIRESHPEVCFWALNDKKPMQYSKTSQPEKAYHERRSVLKTINTDLLSHLGEAENKLPSSTTKDDLMDAFVLSISATPHTARLQTLPENPPTDNHNLSMEISYPAITSDS
jgi:predicted RNase H-like nuclease